jgi:hypothetical protein
MEAKIKSLFFFIMTLGILTSNAYGITSRHIYCENKYDRCANKCAALYGNQGCYNSCDNHYNRCLNKAPRIIDPNIYIQPYTYGVPQQHYWRSYPRHHHRRY